MRRPEPMAAMVLVIAITGVLLPGGCSHPEATRLTQQREARINMWLSEAAERERLGAQRVDAGLQEIDRLWQRDVERTRQNEAKLNEHIRFINERWHDRQPAFEAAIERELRGKPERIEEIGARMVY